MVHRTTIMIVLGGVLAIGIAVLVLNLQAPRGLPMPATPIRPAPATSKAETPRVEPAPAAAAPEKKPEPSPPPAAPSVAPAGDGTSSITQADLDYLSTRNLLLPLEGVKAGQLRDTFTQARSEGRQHDAIDIMAPQGLPVLATTDGVVIKLFQSERGGITLYEGDPSGHYVYYYAHLSRYADGITEGKQLKRGEVIAYVGDTGNAGAGHYHLHFAISKTTSARQWSGGEPINPYPLLAK